MANQTRVIKIKVETTGAAKLDQLSKQLGSVNRNTKQMASSLSFAGNMFRGFIAGIGIRELAKTADTFQLLQDRISVFAGGAERASEVMSDIQVVARNTKSSMQTIAEGFNRIAIATEGTGLSIEQMLGITAGLQQTLRLSGASAQEASSTFLQFSQALSLGRLQGQELRAVMLSNAKLSGILAESLNVTKGELKALGEQGKLTNDKVLKALASNMYQLEKDATKLSVTFEQSLIIALDALRIKISKLNQEFKLSEKFSQFTISVIDNVDQIGIAMIGLATTMAVRAVPTMIASIKALDLSLKSTLIGLAIWGISVAIITLASNWEESTLRMKKAWKEYFEKPILEGIVYFQELSDQFTGWFRKFIGRDFIPIDQTALMKSKAGLGDVNKEISLLDKQLEKFNRPKTADSRYDEIIKKTQEFKMKAGSTAKGPLKDLNDQFRRGSIFFGEYAQRVDDIKIKELNDKFKDGKISVQEYHTQLSKIPGYFEKMSMGKQVMFGLEEGFMQLRTSMGTLAGDIAKAVDSTFKGMEDKMVEFVKTGKFNFKDLAQSILDDMTRIAIRAAILRPIAGELFGSIGWETAGSYVAPANVAAKGKILSSGNIVPFATGGVVSSPTLFPLSGGRTGLMGEKGSEAILPLTRDSSGRLGVNSSGSSTVVNVINSSSGTETETKETVGPNGETQIDIMVIDRVNKGIASGRLDRTMAEVYGLRRKGR